MARYYGSWKTLNTNIKTRAFIDVTTSSTTTAFTVSVHNGYQVQVTKRTGSAVHTVKYNNLAAAILDNNNVIYLNNADYAGRSFTDSGTKTYTYGPYSAHTHTYSRGTSAKTIKVRQDIVGYIHATTKTGSIGAETEGIRIWSVISDSITIPAKPSYTVTYNANGGSIVSGGKSYDTKQYGTVISLPKATNFTRSGYQPVKFNKSAKGTDTSYNFGANYTVTAAATLYVIWQQDYTVKYDPNEGTGGPTTQAKPYNKSITLSTTNPTRKGYSFLGWATSSSSTTVAYKGGETYNSNANLYLYAVWKLEYDSRTMYELNVRGEYNASQKEIPRATQKVTGNSIEAYAEFLGWAIEKPANPIYPPRITSIEDITDIKVYTDINSSMSDTFYAIYRDISPSNIYEIYHDTVIANDSDDVVVEFQNYIDAISSGEDYISTATGDSHTLFGYVQCNTNVDILNNVSGTIDNCPNLNIYTNQLHVGRSLWGRPREYELPADKLPVENTLITLFISIQVDEENHYHTMEFTAGSQQSQTIVEDPESETQLYINYSPPGTFFYQQTGNNTYGRIGAFILDDIKYQYGANENFSYLDIIQKDDKIFFKITNDNITKTSRHTIKITSIDLNDKVVTFTIKNKIKTPIIDISTCGDNWLPQMSIITPHSDCSWYQQRDFASLKIDPKIPSTNTGMYPAIDLKSKSGDWSIVTYNDRLEFSYITDVNYKSKVNSQGGYFRVYPNGGILCKTPYIKVVSKVDSSVFTVPAPTPTDTTRAFTRTFNVNNETSYTPIGIVGYDIDAWSSGDNMYGANVLACRLDGNNAYFQISNFASVQLKLKLYAFVLYRYTG